MIDLSMQESSLSAGDAERTGCSDSVLVSVSQHCFGFIHGFVFCLVMKQLNTATGTDKRNHAVCVSSETQDSSNQDAHGVCTSQVKEETSNETQPQESGHGDLHHCNFELAVGTEHGLPTEHTKMDSDCEISSFYLSLTDVEHENNDNAADREWTDTQKEKDVPLTPTDDQSLTRSVRCKLRKRLKTTHIKDTDLILRDDMIRRLQNRAKHFETAALRQSKVGTRTPSSDAVVSIDNKSACDSVVASVSADTEVYKCEKCNKTFTTARSCKRHSAKVHDRSEGSTKTRKPGVKLLKARCDKCPKIYTGVRAEKNLQQHILAYHSKVEPVQCDVCSAMLNNEHHLKLHKRSSHRKDVCYICGAHFVTQIGLQTHLMVHKGEKSFVCEICGAAFVRVTSLRQHCKFHSVTRDFHCDRCPLSFKTFSSLSIHMMCVHQCGRYFNSQVQKLIKLNYTIDNDNLHRLQNQLCVVCGQELVNWTCPSHSSDCMLTFSCPHCQWTTKDIQKFHKHLVRLKSAALCSASSESKAAKSCAGLMEKTRPPVKNFICPSCGKCFYTHSHLQAHKHQHSEKRFSCPVCGKSFTYKFNMQNHLTTHSDDRPFECKTCKKTFKMKSQLQLHERYHAGEFTCEICGKILTRKQHVMNHYRLVHPERKLAD